MYRSIDVNHIKKLEFILYIWYYRRQIRDIKFVNNIGIIVVLLLLRNYFLVEIDTVSSWNWF